MLLIAVFLVVVLFIEYAASVGKSIFVAKLVLLLFYSCKRIYNIVFYTQLQHFFFSSLLLLFIPSVLLIGNTNEIKWKTLFFILLPINFIVCACLYFFVFTYSFILWKCYWIRNKIFTQVSAYHIMFILHSYINY